VLLHSVRPVIAHPEVVFATLPDASGLPALSCNVLAGFHHDHVLDPVDRALRAALLACPVRLVASTLYIRA
jgi:hypothetical protein